LNPNLKRFLLVLGYLVVAACFYRYGQQKTLDVCKAAMHDKEQEILFLKPTVEYWQRKADHQEILGIKMDQDCLVQHDQAACKALAESLKKFRAKYETPE
jgi:hypothetical protein